MMKRDLPIKGTAANRSKLIQLCERRLRHLLRPSVRASTGNGTGAGSTPACRDRNLIDFLKAACNNGLLAEGK